MKTPIFKWTYPISKDKLNESPKMIEQFSYDVEDSILDADRKITRFLNETKYLLNLFKGDFSNSVFIADIFLKGKKNREEFLYNLPTKLNRFYDYIFVTDVKGNDNSELFTHWIFKQDSKQVSFDGNNINVNFSEMGFDIGEVDIISLVESEDNSLTINRKITLDEIDVINLDIEFKYPPEYCKKDEMNLSIQTDSLDLNNFEFSITGPNKGSLDVNYLYNSRIYDSGKKYDYDIIFSCDKKIDDKIYLDFNVTSYFYKTFRKEITLTGNPIVYSTDLRKFNTSKSRLPNSNLIRGNKSYYSQYTGYDVFEMDNLKIIEKKPTEVQLTTNLFLNEKSELFLISNGVLSETDYISVDELYEVNKKEYFRKGDSIYLLNSDKTFNKIKGNITYFYDENIYSSDVQTIIGDETFNFSISYYSILITPVLVSGKVSFKKSEYILIDNKLFCRGVDIFTDFKKMNGINITNDLYKNYQFEEKNTFTEILDGVDVVSVNNRLIWSNSDGVFSLGKNWLSLSEDKPNIYYTSPVSISTKQARKIYENEDLLVFTEVNSYNTYSLINDPADKNKDNLFKFFGNPDILTEATSNGENISLGFIKDVKNGKVINKLIGYGFINSRSIGIDAFYIDEKNDNIFLDYSFKNDFKGDIPSETYQQYFTVDSNFSLLNASDIIPKLKDVRVTNLFAVARSDDSFYILGKSNILSNMKSHNYKDGEHKLWTKINLVSKIGIDAATIDMWGLISNEGEDFLENMYIVVGSDIYYSGNIFFGNPTTDFHNGWKKIDIRQYFNCSYDSKITSVKLTTGASAIVVDNSVLYLATKISVNGVVFGGLEVNSINKTNFYGNYFKFEIMGDLYDINSDSLVFFNEKIYYGRGKRGAANYNEFSEVNCETCNPNLFSFYRLFLTPDSFGFIGEKNKCPIEVRAFSGCEEDAATPCGFIFSGEFITDEKYLQYESVEEDLVVFYSIHPQNNLTEMTESFELKGLVEGGDESNEESWKTIDVQNIIIPWETDTTKFFVAQYPDFYKKIKMIIYDNKALGDIKFYRNVPMASSVKSVSCNFHCDIDSKLPSVKSVSCNFHCDIDSKLPSVKSVSCNFH